MPIARIIYARGASPAGWLIRRWPDSAPARWSHAGILLPSIPEDDSPALVFEATWPRGAKFTTVDKFRARYSTYEVVAYNVQADDQQQRAWCEARDGQRYATGTVLGRLFGLRASESGDHCSEVAENFLRDMGCVGRWRSDHHLITPNVSFNNLAGVA